VLHLQYYSVYPVGSLYWEFYLELLGQANYQTYECAFWIKFIIVVSVPSVYYQFVDLWMQL
jgi:hypothetical protein